MWSMITIFTDTYVQYQVLINELIKVEWWLYASVHMAIIGSDNGLLPVWHQAIIWTNAG